MSDFKTKADPELGKLVQQRFIEKGIQTPWKDNGLSDKEKIEKIEAHMLEVMKVIGVDVEDDSMSGTPRRLAKLWINDFFSGLNPDHFPKCTTIENKMAVKDEFVCVRNINVTSLCEHHWLPFMGNQPGHAGATVAYIPKDKVIGISKIPRIVQWASRQMQIQERLTHQILEALKVVLETDDVAVYIDAVHTCMTTRGIADPNASTVTCAMSGIFNSNDNVRREFLSIARQQ